MCERPTAASAPQNAKKSVVHAKKRRYKFCQLILVRSWHKNRNEKPEWNMLKSTLGQATHVATKICWRKKTI